MIIYFDSSSLVKLHFRESGSSTIVRLADEADVATSLIAYPEVRSALARKRRERLVSGNEYAEILVEFDAKWNDLLLVQLSDETSHFAGHLAEKHALRGFDALHLASALALKSEAERDGSVLFSSVDARLRDAAEAEGLELAGA